MPNDWRHTPAVGKLLSGDTMVGVIENNRKAIIDACIRHGAKRLDVFGSGLGNEFRAGYSDLDFLVDFGSLDPYQRVDAYFNLRDDLKSLLGSEIDLVMVDAVKNRYIAADIERTKHSLYAA